MKTRNLFLKNQRRFSKTVKHSASLWNFRTYFACLRIFFSFFEDLWEFSFYELTLFMHLILFHFCFIFFILYFYFVETKYMPESISWIEKLLHQFKTAKYAENLFSTFCLSSAWNKILKTQIGIFLLVFVILEKIQKTNK